MILMGRRYMLTPRLTKPQIRLIRQDLGWEPLWCVAVETAIVLRQKMRLDHPEFEHAKWASQNDPPPGTWMKQVSTLQARFSIPDAVLPPSHPTASSTTIPAYFVSYRKQQVQPVVRAVLAARDVLHPLPWGWIIACLRTPSQHAAFSLWWEIRVTGTSLTKEWSQCPACRIQGTPMALHLINSCQKGAEVGD